MALVNDIVTEINITIILFMKILYYQYIKRAEKFQFKLKIKEVRE